MPTTLNIQEIFPGYSLSESAASKAEIDNAITFGGLPIEDDSIPFVVDGVTTTVIFKNSAASPGDDEIHITISTGGSQAANNRNLLKKAINGADQAEIVYGANTDKQQGINGLSALDGSTGVSVKLTSEEVGASTIGYGVAVLDSTSNISVTNAVGDTDTGSDSSGTMNIPLSALGFTENALTTEEVRQGASDFRKFLFHTIEKYYQYLATYDQIDAVSIDGAGANYIVGDLITFTGGSPDVNGVARVAGVDASGGVTSVDFTGGGTKGRGYEAAPTGFNVTTQNGINGNFSATITDRLPANLSLARGSLSEDLDTETLSRLYQVTFGFESTNLTLKGE
jgi:hypothetical protein